MEMRIVRITWRDSNQELYQREQSDVLEVGVFETVGWLLEDNDDHVTVARDLIEKDCRGMLTIPRENIVSLKEV